VKSAADVCRVMFTQGKSNDKTSEKPKYVDKQSITCLASLRLKV